MSDLVSVSSSPIVFLSPADAASLDVVVLEIPAEVVGPDVSAAVEDPLATAIALDRLELATTELQAGLLCGTSARFWLTYRSFAVFSLVNLFLFFD